MRHSLCLRLTTAILSASPMTSFIPNVSQSRLFSTIGGASTSFLPGRRDAQPHLLGLTNDNDRIVPSGGGKSDGSKTLVAAAILAALSTVCVAAKIGILPGILLEDGTFSRYTDSMIARDAGATVLTAGLAYAFVKIMTFLAKSGRVDPKDSRKIIHTFTGPLFIVTWPIFSPAFGARFFASVVTLVNGIRLYLAATGEGDESDLANAVSRSGDAKEALGGPFLYVLTITAAILLFWRTSLTGIVAVSTMAAGDGVADLVGRRFGKNNKWPDSNKSIAGSLAFVVASTLTSVGLAAWMSYTGCLTLPMDMAELVPRIGAISVVCAGVELLPFADDNWTVPLSAAILSALFLQ